MTPRKGSSVVRKFLLKGVFNFLSNNCRGWTVANKIPARQAAGGWHGV